MKEEIRLSKAVSSSNKETICRTFEYFYLKYKPLIAFIISKYVNNSNDIDDLINDTFLDFFNHASQVKKSVKGYLCFKARSVAINFIKKKSKFELSSDIDVEDLLSIDSSYSHINYNETIELMNKVLEKEDVEIILLHLENDFSFNEIAKKKQMSENTVKTKYFRGLKKLRKRGKIYE